MSERMAGVRWAKGHGTENDFVLIEDVDGGLELNPQDVRRLCDRRAGIGADGVLRVVRQDGTWFMDYRNGDGSIAEMCGNGIRVYVAYLLHAGLAALAEGESITIATRAGAKQVRRTADGFAAQLGPWHLPGGAAAVAAGGDQIVVTGRDVDRPGLAVDVGNPHVVLLLPDEKDLARVDLTAEPTVRPVPPNGINVELVVLEPVGNGVGRLRMRVFERGVGETRSCGTGAVAAVLAARALARHVAGERADSVPDDWQVRVPGGLLRVRVDPADRVAGELVELAGPAVIVADGTLTGH